MGMPIRADISRNMVKVESDSCATGMGAVDWMVVDWEAEGPRIANLHINHKEAAAVIAGPQGGKGVMSLFI